MSARSFHTYGVAGTTALLFLAGGMLHWAASGERSLIGSRGGLTKALQRQSVWLVSDIPKLNPPAVAPEYKGLGPEAMARRLRNRSVVSGTTGLLKGPNAKFGISADMTSKVNDAILIALGRVAGAEKATMEQVKSSDLFTRYRIPANAEAVKEEMESLHRVAVQVLPDEVAAGFMVALRETEAFRPYERPRTVTLSAGASGLMEAGAQNSFPAESVALKLRWSHLLHPAAAAGEHNTERRGEDEYLEIFDRPLQDKMYRIDER